MVDRRGVVHPATGRRETKVDRRDPWMWSSIFSLIRRRKDEERRAKAPRRKVYFDHREVNSLYPLMLPYSHERRDRSTTAFRYGGKRKYDREDRRLHSRRLVICAPRGRRTAFFERRTVKGFHLAVLPDPRERRVATALRRARGNGIKHNTTLVRRVQPPFGQLGRRATDETDHVERRRGFKYTGSRDPRVRALERRKAC